MRVYYYFLQSPTKRINKTNSQYYLFIRHNLFFRFPEAIGSLGFRVWGCLGSRFRGLRVGPVVNTKMKQAPCMGVSENASLCVCVSSGPHDFSLKNATFTYTLESQSMGAKRTFHSQNTASATRLS